MRHWKNPWCTNKEICTMDMGFPMAKSFLEIEGCFMQCTLIGVPRPVQIVCCCYECFKFGSWGHFNARSRFRSLTHSIHESIFEAYQKMVFSLWKGICSGCILLHPIATLFQGLSRRCHYHDGSQAVNTPNGLESFIPAPDTLSLAWNSPIDPTEDCIPTGQS